MKRAGAGLAIILTGCLLVFGIARFGGKQALPRGNGLSEARLIKILDHRVGYDQVYGIVRHR